MVLDVTWWLPLPLYVEHSLAPLFMVSAFAGLWSGGQWIVTRIRVPSVTIPSLTIPSRAINARRLAPRSWILFLAGLAALLLVLLAGMAYSFERAKIVLARYYTTPWVNELELVDYLVHSTGLSAGQTYRGSSLALTVDTESLANLWKRGVPTLDEYSQLVTPQAFYLQAALLGSPPDLNSFGLGVRIAPDVNIELIFKTLEALGVRYIFNPSPLLRPINGRYPVCRFRADHTMLCRETNQASGIFMSFLVPISAITVQPRSSSPILDILAITGTKDFDFRRRVVLPSGSPSLVPARVTRLTINRGGGFHVFGNSDGVSLILLPQQFSHCMKASGSNVRIVRADLLWTGVIFSGTVDTDISFDYGVFSPGCRRADIADLTRLGIAVPVLPATGRQGVTEKFQVTIDAIKSVW